MANSESACGAKQGLDIFFFVCFFIIIIILLFCFCWFYLYVGSFVCAFCLSYWLFLFLSVQGFDGP